METNLLLLAVGMLGILLHNLIKMDAINRKAKGELNYLKYLSLEKFSILISIVVVVIALIAKLEIKQLQIVSNYLYLGFVAIGYMAQSIVVSYMGKAEKFLSNEDAQSLIGDQPSDPRNNPPKG